MLTKRGGGQYKTVKFCTCEKSVSSVDQSSNLILLTSLVLIQTAAIVEVPHFHQSILRPWKGSAKFNIIG